MELNKVQGFYSASITISNTTWNIKQVIKELNEEKKRKEEKQVAQR